MGSKVERIVPIRDRRRGRRILTLRNLGFAALALLIIFLGISLRSEMRGGTASGDYGRLYSNELPKLAPIAKAPEVVTEAPAQIDDQNAADPTLMQPQARAQWLEPAPVAPPVTPSTPPRPPAGRGEVAIVGGPDGVTTTSTSGQEPRRVLRGGIFKPTPP